MTEEITPGRDDLDNKVNRVFAGKVVRKDLVRKVKVGSNVPVFVLEYLLGKYCASSDEMAIQMGMKVVNDILADNYIQRRPALQIALYAVQLPYSIISIANTAVHSDQLCVKLGVNLPGQLLKMGYYLTRLVVNYFLLLQAG